MSTEDKFAKNIDDDELDNVAGGITEEMQKDIQFLYDLKLADLDAKNRVEKNDDEVTLKKLWARVYVSYLVDNKGQSHYRDTFVRDETSLAGSRMSRQGAMIRAMRATRKVLDLDNYL